MWLIYYCSNTDLEEIAWWPSDRVSDFESGGPWFDPTGGAVLGS